MRRFRLKFCMQNSAAYTIMLRFRPKLCVNPGESLAWILQAGFFEDFVRNSTCRIMGRFRSKFCTQHSVEMAAKSPHVRCRPKFCMQSSAEISAENMHSYFCRNFDQQMHAWFCRNFGRNSARRVHLRMQPKFWTRRFRPKYLQKSEGRIWAKSLQNSALRISSQLSAEFSLQNFGQNGCRIVDAEFLTSSAFAQQIM